MPILLLHGQPGHGADWEPLIAAIGTRSDVVALDRPGWDGRGLAGGFAHSAAAAREALDRLGWQRAAVVGHSYGAGVASWFAIENPERIDSLVLLAPSANTASLLTVDRLLAIPWLEPIAGATLSAGARAVASSHAVSALAARGLRVEQRWLRAAARPLVRRADWRPFFIEQRLQIRELPVLESRLGFLRAATTIVAGGSDRVVPLRSARLLARQIPGAHLIVLPRGGHMLVPQHPHRLAEIILRSPSRTRAPRQGCDQAAPGANISHDSSKNACAAGG